MADLDAKRRAYVAAKRAYLIAGRELGQAEKIHKPRTPVAKVRVRHAEMRVTAAGRTAAKAETRKIQSIPQPSYVNENTKPRRTPHFNKSKRNSYREALWRSTLSARRIGEEAMDRGPKRGKQTRGKGKGR